MITRFLLMILCVTLFTACEKEEIKEAEEKVKACRLTTITLGSGAHDSVYLVKQDTLGRIIEVEDKYLKRNYKILYRGDTKNPSGIEGSHLTITYTYDQDEALQMVVASTGERFVFTNNDGKISKGIWSVETRPGSGIWEDVYTYTPEYDAAGRMVKYTVHEMDGTLYGMNEIVYTAIPNEWQALGYLCLFNYALDIDMNDLFVGFDRQTNNSKYMVKSYTLTSMEDGHIIWTDIDYTYDAEGKIISSTTSSTGNKGYTYLSRLRKYDFTCF